MFIKNRIAPFRTNSQTRKDGQSSYPLHFPMIFEYFGNYIEEHIHRQANDAIEIFIYTGTTEDNSKKDLHKAFSKVADGHEGGKEVENF